MEKGCLLLQQQPNKPKTTKQTRNKPYKTTRKKACAHRTNQQQPKEKLKESTKGHFEEGIPCCP